METVSDYPWDAIKGFQSPAEFRRFDQWMADQINAGVAEQVTADSTKIQYWAERWFRHSASQTIWRLAPPDPPFTGVFERITDGR